MVDERRCAPHHLRRGSAAAQHAAALVLAVLPAAASAADWKFGVRGGYYTDIGEPVSAPTGR